MNLLYFRDLLCMNLLYFRDLLFELDLKPSDCEFQKLFDEGVEISVGNWEKNGEWIPLIYVIENSIRSLSMHNINIVPIDTKPSNYISIRGYTVPVYMQNSSSPLLINISVCGEDIVRNGVQFRWLQTTSLYVQKSGYQIRDAWTMKDVSTTNPVCSFTDTMTRR